MATRSLNRVQLIGNLTRDPELRYTPQGTAVCSFGLATNRSWATDTGERREETEFHRIVSWNKLAELCSQLCTKGRKVYVEGRLSTRTWTGQDGAQRTTTEIVIDDMILLDSRRPEAVGKPSEEAARGVTQSLAEGTSQAPVAEEESTSVQQPKSTKKKQKKSDTQEQKQEEEQINPDDIPF